MNCRSEKKATSFRAFTLIEVAVALAVLSAIIASVVAIMGRCINTSIDMQLQQQAFELARERMETLLSESTVSDLWEYGFSEENPGIDWQFTVEPFSEPSDGRMWIRAVSSAGFKDTAGQGQKVEFACWITGLTDQQAKQILAQQNRREKFADKISGSKYEQYRTGLEEMTIGYLNAAGLDATAYREFAEKQKGLRADYVAQNGYDDGYTEIIDTAEQDETDFLYHLGVNFNDYDNYIKQYTE